MSFINGILKHSLEINLKRCKIYQPLIAKIETFEGQLSVFLTMNCAKKTFDFKSKLKQLLQERL
jgi:hypothetical protein